MEFSRGSRIQLWAGIGSISCLEEQGSGYDQSGMESACALGLAAPPSTNATIRAFHAFVLSAANMTYLSFET